MVVLNNKERLMIGLGVGRFGYTQADRLGLRTYEEALAENPYAGIYQTRRNFKGRYHVRMKFYVPYNPQTETQQAWRQKFKDAVDAYRVLDSVQLEYHRKRGLRYKMTAYNSFISTYLKLHKFD